MPHPTLRIAVIGAECTGKSTLVGALQQALHQPPQRRCYTVAEYLRTWCNTQGRTPHPDEQAHIAHTQAAQFGQRSDDCSSVAASGCVVISDTTPLVTAVYSDVLFNDRSLYPFALAQQRGYDACLLTGLDVNWVADGIQRDGPAQRLRFDQRLREVLVQEGLAFHTITGQGEARTHNALNALARVLGRTPQRSRSVGKDTGAGCDTAGEAASAWQWQCEKCSDAQCEHRLFSALLQPKK